MRAFGYNEFMFIVFALEWTLKLTAIAFVGGGLAGVGLALLRVSRFASVRLLATPATRRRT